MMGGEQGNPVIEWRELAAAAILGTDRIAEELPVIGGERGALLARRATEDGAARMLEAAAVLGMYERAGRQVHAAGKGRPASPEPDDRPECSQRAGAILARIFGDRA